MQAFASGQELRWIKPKVLKLQFELHTGETTVATLAWTRGSRALGQWGEHRYWFSREGFFRPRVLVRSASNTTAKAPTAQDQALATFTNRGGTLTFTDGLAFLWKRPQRWTNERIWTDTAATELVRFHPETWGSTTRVTSQPAFASIPELPLLTLLGQYLIVLAAQDATAASSAATVAVVASS